MSGSGEDALPASLEAVCWVLPWLKEEQLALQPFLSEQGQHHMWTPLTQHYPFLMSPLPYLLSLALGILETQSGRGVV